MQLLLKSDAARSWEGSAVLGVSPMSDCRGSPHERLHQDKEKIATVLMFEIFLGVLRWQKH
ncbi:hypothetical protein [Moorena sp. SIO3H5]|uniref:hypothetical protein n=1 Tax=Moorena sp. SIO3H5 TaxID=2607834 RepID=UPI0013BDAA37|nr:hypothetical protein [Moorena sp. SIO3H5]NEO74351.1 hypothetical protein [Moorena sp. SIO3H5]